MTNDEGRERTTPRTTMVVGVGASAGGIPALVDLFSATSPGDGLAFVVVQHLDPHAESAMAKILGERTPLTVEEAEDGMIVEPDHVYTLPAGREMTIRDGALRLSQRPSGRAGNFPINAFFASLAEDQGERAVAVVLSGSGSDGAIGLKEVKARGGFTLAQEASTAQQSAMPEHAVATGMVDIVAVPGVIPSEIVAYARHLQRFAPESEHLEGLQEVLTVLQIVTGMDLSSYKPGTLTRRIRRRMSLRHAKDVDDYLKVLRKDDEEVHRLRKDILIGVTSFFRDAQAFDALQETVIAALFDQSDEAEGIRAWVSGCSTGEEAYSIAILLLEQKAATGSTLPVRVFATDANDDAIELARTGVFDEGALVGVSPTRLSRFFEADEPGRYRATPELRNVITFATQDLLADPPFSQIDLVSCRNVLIYLERAAQRRVLLNFHFSLKPGGYLFLGRSEGAADELPFELVSNRWRIFRRRAKQERQTGEEAVPRIQPPRQPPRTTRLPTARPRSRESSPAEIAAEWLLDAYVPASVVIDHRHAILALHGPVERYLNLPRGDASLDLLVLPKEGLRSHVRTAVYRAAREGAAIRVTGASLRTPAGAAVNVDVRVEHVGPPSSRLMLVVFEETQHEAAGQRQARTVEGPGHDATYVRQIEDELEQTKQVLEDTAETWGREHEELQASNEEVTSMNEELRAANEELSASKEELQVLNEEANEARRQLRDRVDALEQVTDDLNNLLAATGIATIYLDREFHIVRATPAARGLLSIRAGDVGRPLHELAWGFTDPDLRADALRVLEDLVPIEKEVRADDDRRYLRRIIPYRSRDQRIEGVFVTLRDIEEARRARDDVETARDLAESIVATVRHPLVILDEHARVVTCNPAFCRRFRVEAEKVVGHSFFRLRDGLWDFPDLRTLVETMLPERTEIHDHVLTHDVDGEGAARFLVNGRRMRGPDDHPLILLAIEEGPDAP